MLLNTRKAATTTILKERRRWSATLLAVVCTAYLLAICGAAALLWTASDRWWPATVLLFAPRWTLAVPLAILIPLALIYHRRSLVILAASGAVLVMAVMGYTFSLGGGSLQRSDGSLRIVSYNIHRSQLDVEAFRKLIHATRPDVIALQDWTSKHEGVLFDEPGWYTQRDGELFIASRFPITRSREVLSPPTEQPGFVVRYGAAQAYELLTPDGPITLVNLHLASPHEALQALRAGQANFAEQLEFNSQQRDIESARIDAYLATLQSPAVIVGDFNTPRESPIFRHYFGRFVNALSARGSGFGLTHVSMASSVRIDHVLLTGGFDVRECWLASAAGSPHRPMITDLTPDRTATLQSASAEP